MCDRYRIRGDLEEVTSNLPGVLVRGPLRERFNVAPGQFAPVIRKGVDGAIEMVDMVWGLPPKSVTDPDAGPTTSLEHHEAATRIGHRESYLYRRCLVPCNGFFAWQQATKHRRVPWLLTYPGEEIMMMAGMWESVPGKPDAFAVLNSSPPNRVAWIHYQYPVLVPSNVWRAWLDPETSLGDLAAIVHIGHTKPNRDLQQWRVTSRVASPDFEDPAAVVPIPPKLRR